MEVDKRAAHESYTRRRFRLPFFWVALFCIATAQEAGAIRSSETYLGLEYFGSNRPNHDELERLVNLKIGADGRRVSTTAERLRSYFEKKHQRANVEIVSAGDQKLVLVVDLVDPLSSVVTRRLNSPHKVRLASEKPFILLAAIQGRLSKLEQEGRPARAEWRDTYKFFSDEPVNQMIEEIQKFDLPVRSQLIEIVESDPDPLRRAQALTLLAWGSEPEDTAINILPALDDADLRVRIEGAKYFYAKSSLLGDQFPYDGLIEALAHMLNRPTHQDRSNALHCLLKLCQVHGETIPLVKRLAEGRVNQLSQESILPTIKQTAERLIILFAAQPKFASPDDKGASGEDPGL